MHAEYTDADLTDDDEEDEEKENDDDDCGLLEYHPPAPRHQETNTHSEADTLHSTYNDKDESTPMTVSSSSSTLLNRQDLITSLQAYSQRQRGIVKPEWLLRHIGWVLCNSRTSSKTIDDQQASLSCQQLQQHEGVPLSSSPHHRAFQGVEHPLADHDSCQAGRKEDIDYDGSLRHSWCHPKPSEAHAFNPEIIAVECGYGPVNANCVLPGAVYIDTNEIEATPLWNIRPMPELLQCMQRLAHHG